jgi:hypothetical protein
MAIAGVDVGWGDFPDMVSHFRAIVRGMVGRIWCWCWQHWRRALPDVVIWGFQSIRAKQEIKSVLRRSIWTLTFAWASLVYVLNHSYLHEFFHIDCGPTHVPDP